MSIVQPPIPRNLWEKASLVLGNGFLTKTGELQAIKPLSTLADFTVARNTGKYVRNLLGNWVLLGSNETPLDFDPVTGRWSIWPENGAVNQIRNNSMQGASVGSQTLPTGWTLANRGLNQTILNVGVVNGIDVIDIRLNGTANASGFIELNFIASNLVAAAISQVWNMSVFYQLLASPAAPASQNIYLSERNSVGTDIGATTTAIATPTTFMRHQTTRTLNQAATAFIMSRLNFGVVVGQSYDFTIRVGWPQMGLGLMATSPIRTTNGSGTRAADNIFLNNASSLIGQTEGTLYIEMLLVNETETRTIVTLSDNTSTNRIRIRRVSATLLEIDRNRAGQANLSLNVTIPSSGLVKMALAYSNIAGGWVVFVNGNQVTTHAPAVPTFTNELTRFNLGANFDGTVVFANRIFQLITFTNRLSTSELTALTSL